MPIAVKLMKHAARLFYLLIFLHGITLITYSQQGNVWYFGLGAGLTFNTDPPSALLDGQIFTNEGCATICDHTGRLLFYTDGTNVLNRSHQQMPNGTGLKGSPSSTSSAIIIPKPGSTTIFYIFTAGAVETNNEGYFYSEVDMSLQGGLGDITANKNIHLYNPSTEKLTAVRHSNGVDVWVVTKALGNTEWKVFKVDCNGVNTIPVVSVAGHPPSLTSINVNVGYMKASPDGTKIAAANAGDGIWELFNFDASTGILSNGLQFPIPDAPFPPGQPPGGNWPFGVEFSPDSKLIYVASEWLAFSNHGGIYQYNLATYDSAAIGSTKLLIGNASLPVGALQLGPDNKIYCALGGTFATSLRGLGVINAPNLPGLACGYVDHQVDLQGRIARRGLPTFFPGLITNKDADFNYTIDANCGTVNFSATSTIPGNVIWQWDFGDGTTGMGQTVSHTYAAGGPTLDTVTLTVTSIGSCGAAIAVKKINLDPGTPVAKFGFAKQCGSLAVNFYDSSVAGGSSLQNWLWDFGDGNTSTQQYPTHVFAGYGSYDVTLTVGLPGTCHGFAAIQKNILITARPVADFSNTKTCVNQPVSFTDRSFIAAGNISQWFWDFGDGTKSNLQSPQKIFATAGTYEVILTVSSSAGCISDTLKRNITVTSTPTAGFNAIDGCVGKIIALQDASTINGGNITRWFWSFGDGNRAVIQNPVISYPAPGSYTIKQVVESNAGCISDTASSTILVESTPVAGMVAFNGCQQQVISFRDASSIDFGTIRKWNWRFGDGNISALQNPPYVYATPNNYTVQLSVESANGCASDTVSKNILIEAIPAVAFTHTEACAGLPIQFTNTTSISFGTIIGYTWNFGEGTVSTLIDPVHRYTLYGNFTITLAAATTNGCTATASKIFHIAPVRAFAGNDTIVAVGQPVQLRATGGQHYQWSPPDFLNTDTVFNPVAVLAKDQRYRVKVTTAEGCIDFDDISIRVLKGPDIYVPNAFTPDGKNKVFRPILAGVQELYYFSVFNRWGQRVFTTHEPGKGWDGKINGVTQPTGTFVWMLKAKDYLGRVITKNGTVLLIR